MFIWHGAARRRGSAPLPRRSQGPYGYGADARRGAAPPHLPGGFACPNVAHRSRRSMSTRWGALVLTLGQVLEATGGTLVGALPRSETRFSRVVVDSRAVTARALFVALRGETHDGHAFVTRA